MAGYSIDPGALQRGAARREIAVAKPGVRRVPQQFAPQPSAGERREDMAIRAALQTGAGLIGALGQGAVQVGAKEGGWMHQAFTPDEILREQAIKRRLEREGLAARTAYMRGTEGREGAKSDAATRRALMQQQMMTGRMREQQGLTTGRMREQQGLMGEREQALARLKAMLKKRKGKGGWGKLSGKTQGYFDPATGQFVPLSEVDKKMGYYEKLSGQEGFYDTNARDAMQKTAAWVSGRSLTTYGAAKKSAKAGGFEVKVGAEGLPVYTPGDIESKKPPAGKTPPTKRERFRKAAAAAVSAMGADTLADAALQMMDREGGGAGILAKRKLNRMKLTMAARGFKYAGKQPLARENLEAELLSDKNWEYTDPGDEEAPLELGTGAPD